MEFRKTKLPLTAAEKLSALPIAKVKPFVIVHVPHYVLLRRNEKFVCVKKPLDFFTPQELEQLAGYGEFFVPDLVENAMPFVDSARRVKAVLSWIPPVGGTGQDIGASSFELGDAIVQIVGPLWGLGVSIEPFLASVFVNELCESVSASAMLAARDNSIALLEDCTQCSAWTVFLALHLGYLDIGFLSRLRQEAFAAMCESALTGRASLSHEYVELIQLARRSFDSRLSNNLPLETEFFGRTDISVRVAQKVVAKLSRVKRDFVETGKVIPMLVVAREFIDV